MSTMCSLLISEISGLPAGVLYMDLDILGLLWPRKSCWGNCFPGHSKRIVFSWENGFCMARLPLFGARTLLPFHQCNSPQDTGKQSPFTFRRFKYNPRTTYVNLYYEWSRFLHLKYWLRLSVQFLLHISYHAIKDPQIGAI